MIAATLGTLPRHPRPPTSARYVETLILMAIDFQASMPFMIIALSVLAFFGNNLAAVHRPDGLPFVGALRPHHPRPDAWPPTSRATRAAVRQLGAGPGRIYGLHILPNIASTLIVSMTLTFPEIILLESGLSFLGLGVQPPLTSLGNMVGYGPRVHHPRALDHAGAGQRVIVRDDALDQPC